MNLPGEKPPTSLRSFPRKRESRAKSWVPAFAGTNGRKYLDSREFTEGKTEMTMHNTPTARFLMCRPEHFAVIYTINPWMNP